jgi:phenylpropionate dioxygenase-like ring-hydroxylating dioxygenase large terminal subunit
MATSVARGTYEAQLCAALMDILAGDHELARILERLNEGDVRPPAGGAWTEDELVRTLETRAPVPPKAVAGPVFHAEWDRERACPSPGAPTVERTPAEHENFLLTYGLRNKWYVIASSAEVTSAPLGMTRLGEQLVVWRDAGGRVHALEDRCPHRGIALSIGELRDEVLTCGYHGVQVDTYGKVVRVPALPGCALEGKTLIKSYPVIEHFQAIWAYFGDERHPEPPPLELPLELVSPEWTGVIHTDVWDGDYRYVWDNLVDPMHGPYLHSQTYTQSRGPKSDEIALKDTGHGFEVYREGQRGVNLDWIEFVDGGTALYSRVEIPMPPNAGPGGYMGIIFYPTPIDEGHTRINVWRLRKVSGWQRNLWHFLFRERILGFVNAVLAQDKNALAFMPRWPAPERLYAHDIGITRLRKFMREAAKQQARELVS